MRCRAFTLLELLVVLVLSGLLTLAASFAWRSLAAAAQVESSLESIEFFDQQVRSHARGFHREQHLVFELGSDRIRAVGEDDQAPPQRELRLANSQIGGVHAVVNGTLRDVDTIEVSPDGQTTTYVVEVHGPGKLRNWLLFCGVTGEPFRLEQESDVEHLRQLVAPSRPDAP